MILFLVCCALGPSQGTISSHCLSPLLVAILANMSLDYPVAPVAEDADTTATPIWSFGELNAVLPSPSSFGTVKLPAFIPGNIMHTQADSFS